MSERRQRHCRCHQGRAASERGENFFNWLLSREGQELHGKTAQQPTRRLDVDTKGLDGQAAKDVMTLDEFKRFQNFGVNPGPLDSNLVEVRIPQQ